MAARRAAGAGRQHAIGVRWQHALALSPLLATAAARRAGRQAPRCAAAVRRASSSIEYPAPRSSIAWRELGFGMATRDSKMIVTNCTAGSVWGDLRSEPYGALSLEPAATILNYGQGIFEGIKAYRTERGRIVLFRPQKNGKRMADGARRMLMQPLPPALFMQACGMAVTENADLVPPCGQGALYLRPLLFGSGADLGVKPSSEYTFVVYVSPVGQYFGPGTTGARMQLCTSHQRAAPAGVGHVKCVGNYAQCFAAQREAKSDGFSDVIYLDVDGENIDEAAASNFFCVDQNRVVYTPPLGTILPGVTRDSIIQLIRSRLQSEGVQLKVGKLPASVALSASEAFLTGTGAGITPVEHICSEEESVNFPCPGPVTKILQKMLSDIQAERVEDSMNWLHDPFVDAAFSRDSYNDPVF